MPLNPNYSGVQQNIQITEVNGLQSALDTKQAIINDGDLSISKVSGLQTALDNEASSRTTSVDDLQTQIIDLGNTLGTTTENTQSRITTEIDDRTNADLILQSAIDTKQPIIGDGDLSISNVDGLQTTLDSLSSGGGGGGGGGGGSSILKEYFSRYCLGQSVSTSQGDIILANITTEQSITNTIYNSNTVYINGSSISYIPPENTSIVEYEFSFYCYSEGASDNLLQLECHIDGITQTPTRQKILLNGSSVGPANNRGQMLYTFKTLIEINGIADNADKCSLNTWTTSKTLSLKIAKWGSTNLWLHKHDDYFTSTGFVTTVIPPTLTIKAY